MSEHEHDLEPVRGLPATLPAGETILWQGAPHWEFFARRALRVNQVAAYFAVLVVWGIWWRVSSGTPIGAIAVSAAWLAALGVVAEALLFLFAWLVARTTVYTITNRRVVMRFGIALPMTIQIPFQKIEGAALRTWSGGAGDISLSLVRGQRVAYLMQWPHTRPWKMTRAQPSLRAIADAASVAQILGRALAASASQSATAVAQPARGSAASGAQMPATA